MLLVPRPTVVKRGVVVKELAEVLDLLLPLAFAAAGLSALGTGRLLVAPAILGTRQLDVDGAAVVGQPFERADNGGCVLFLDLEERECLHQVDAAHVDAAVNVLVEHINHQGRGDAVLLAKVDKEARIAWLGFA